jgi:hypothetical protein
LKKRTKKRLLLWAGAIQVPQLNGQSFFASFCSQKEVVPRLGLTQTAPIFGEITKT